MGSTGARLVGLVVAAGLSSRMEAFKPLLPLGDRTVIERVVESLRGAGVSDIRVVTGHRAESLAPVLASLRVRPVKNAHYQDGMFSSVRAGVETLTAAVDGFFVLPADYPLVRPETIARLAKTFREAGAGLVHPTYEGRRGHPPLISGRHISAILGSDGAGGLRAVLRALDGDAVEVAVDDPGVRLDLDTPEDYRRMLALFPGSGGCPVINPSPGARFV